MRVEKIYQGPYIIEVPPCLYSKTDEIREWLMDQTEPTLFYPPLSEIALPGTLYFCNEDFATLFILRWS